MIVRRVDPEEVCDMFGVEAHIAFADTDLRPGYWERALAKRVRRASIRARLRRLVRRR